MARRAEGKVRDVKPSAVLQWLQKQRQRYATGSYNEFVQFIRRMFDLAVKDRVLIASPAVDVSQAKRETPIRDTPTWEEFHAIVADMRAQKRNADSQDSADCCELMGLAGLGNAEVEGLTWGDVDFKNNRIRVYRQKTSTGFSIPIYPQLRPLLEKLHGKKKRAPDERVLKVIDIRKALDVPVLGSACPITPPARSAAASSRGPWNSGSTSRPSLPCKAIMTAGC